MRESVRETYHVNPYRSAEQRCDVAGGSAVACVVAEVGHAGKREAVNFADSKTARPKSRSIQRWRSPARWHMIRSSKGNMHMALPLLAFIIMGGAGLIGLLVLVLDIIAIVSVLGGTGSIERKLLWTVIILLLPLVGMILYFLIGRSGRDA
jgi:hypothetical protein